MRWYSLLAIVALVAGQTSAVPRVLLYTKTAGFRHDSIPLAIETVTALGDGSALPATALDDSIAQVRWTTVNSEDQTQFRDYSYLAQFDAIGFVSTTDVDPPGTGTVLDDQGLENLAKYLQAGGGFFGVHSASATLFGAPFYGRAIGAYFDYHPAIQNVSVKPVSSAHPSTSKLPEDGFEIYEEVYNFRSDPRELPSPANVLLTNASSYADGGVNPQGFRNGTNGPSPHPLAWWREGGLLDTDSGTSDSLSGGGGAAIQVAGGPGRMWYTSLGHDNSTWNQDLFKSHIAGGIGWVLQSQTVRANNDTASVGQSSSTGSTSSTTGSSSNAAILLLPTYVSTLLVLTCTAALLLVNM